MKNLSPTDRLTIAKYHPFRTPAFPWILAQELASERNSLGTCSDPSFATAVEFSRATKAAITPDQQGEVARRFPDLHRAYIIYAANNMVRAEIEARLLRQPPSVIAAIISIPIGTIEAYACTFFDVGDTRHITDWHFMQAAGVGQWTQPPNEAATWKYIACVAPPLVLDYLIADYHGRPAPACRNRRMMAQRARFLAREFFDSLHHAIPSPSLMRDANLFFGHMFADTPEDDKQKRLHAQHDFLQFAADHSTIPVSKRRSKTLLTRLLKPTAGEAAVPSIRKALPACMTTPLAKPIQKACTSLASG